MQAKQGDGAVQLANDSSSKEKGVSVLLSLTTASAAALSTALAEVAGIQHNQLAQSQAGLMEQCPISWIKEKEKKNL